MKALRIIGITLAVLLLLAAAALFVGYQRSNLETQSLDETARRQAPGQFIELPDGLVHYQLGGPEAGRVVVLVHGFSVPYYIWEATYQQLVEEGFRVLRYDIYGRGFSARPNVPYEASLYRRQLLGLIEGLQLKTPVHLAGLSFGGPVAADFAIHHPELVDKLALLDPAYQLPAMKIPRWLASLGATLRSEAMAEGQLTDFKDPEAFPGWVEKYKVQMQFKGFRRALLSTLYDYGADIPANYSRLDELDKDILLIWGKEDQTVPFRFSDSIRARLRVEFLPVEGARHLPHLEQPELVNPRIVDFLRKGKSGQSAPRLSVGNPSLYHPAFLEELRALGMHPGYTLREDWMLIEGIPDTIRFPSAILPLDTPVTFYGCREKRCLELQLERLNLTSIRYRLDAEKFGFGYGASEDTVFLSPTFMMASEVDEEEKSGASYFSTEYTGESEGCQVAVRLGENDEGALVAKVIYQCPEAGKEISLEESPNLYKQ